MSIELIVVRNVLVKPSFFPLGAKRFLSGSGVADGTTVPFEARAASAERSRRPVFG